jgi:hypothetical protein
MADSKRLATVKALCAHLAAEIRIDNGYKHDLTSPYSVVRGRYKFDDADPLPQVSVMESPNPDRFPNRAGDQDWIDAEEKELWTLYLQGWVEDDKLNPTDPAYELMADVKKALAKLVQNRGDNGAPRYPEIYLLGGLINGIRWEGGTVRPPDQNSAKAFFWMRVILEFTENLNDPFDHG